MKKLLLLISLTTSLFSFSQNVGIGTNNPSYKLHVDGGDIFLQSSAGSFRFGYHNGNQWRYATTNGGADLLMVSSTDGSNSNYRHYFQQDGSVGFNTGSTSPIANFDLRTNSTSSATSALMIRDANGDTLMRIRNNGYVGIGYNGSSYGRPLNIQGSGMNFYDSGVDYGGSIFPNNGSMVLWSSSNVTLQPSFGSVTIGSYTPASGYKLSVDGKIIVEEARVQLSTSWPDYVFHSNYKLPSFQELSQYISRHKHLPNMPSAAEIEGQKGFDLGDMQKRLVEKVEELTLYILQLKKENEAMHQRILALEKDRK